MYHCLERERSFILVLPINPLFLSLYSELDCVLETYQISNALNGFSLVNKMMLWLLKVLNTFNDFRVHSEDTCLWIRPKWQRIVIFCDKQDKKLK